VADVLSMPRLTLNFYFMRYVARSGGARILAQVGPEAGPKVIW